MFLGRSFHLISITNLAERHLRPVRSLFILRWRILLHINHESSRKAFETSPLPRGAGPPLQPDINHESSRKAFETGASADASAIKSPQISITNLAERHLRPAPASVIISSQVGISITNLAERHLRHDPNRFIILIIGTDINHESSRKAFETRGWMLSLWRQPHIGYQSRI